MKLRLKGVVDVGDLLSIINFIVDNDKFGTLLSIAIVLIVAAFLYSHMNINRWCSIMFFIGETEDILHFHFCIWR